MRVHLLEKTTGAQRVDHEAGIVRGVKVLGAKSRNGRTYSRAALEQAVSLYEGKKVNLNHPKRRSEPDDDRDVRDTVGVLKNARLRGDAVYADFHVFRSHPDAAWILERAELAPESFGFSHDARGVTKGKRGNEIVTELLEVQSVDLVDTPATVAGLYESVMRNKTMSQFRKMKRICEEVQAGVMTAAMLAEELQAVLDDSALDDAGKLDAIRAVLEAVGAAEPAAGETPLGESRRPQRSHYDEAKAADKGQHYVSEGSEALARRLTRGW